MPSSRYERAARSAGYRSIAGVDEAGRGALFGPVFAAAVVLDPSRQIRGLDDSKQLDADRRAMKRAVELLRNASDFLLIDAITVDLPLSQRAIIHGDSLSFSIAAASILAKTARDNALMQWDRVFPGYGFSHNKGYGTPDHLAALGKLGPTTLHRFSFEPVRNACNSQDYVWSGYPEQGELFRCL
jgi:ribonuclease HII